MFVEVNLCSQRLTAPGEGKQIGPSLGSNRSFLQGIYMAPQAVVNALKTGMLASYILEKLGVEVYPKYNEVRSDIVTRIIFNDKDNLLNLFKEFKGLVQLIVMFYQFPLLHLVMMMK